MEANEYQRRALSTFMPLDTDEALKYCALGLTGEAGEVSEHIKKAFYHGHPLDRMKLKLELGDCAWYIVVMAQELGFTLEEIMVSNLEKLGARYPDGWSEERSRDRDADRTG